jgi:acetyl esterase
MGGNKPGALNGSPSRCGLAGDSAGGTVAALACLQLRDRYAKAMPEVQILLCPNTDLGADTQSIREKGVGFGLDAELLRWFARQWVPDPGRWTDPLVSPLRAGDLSGLPSALIVTAEHDPLRDEGEDFAHRLMRAGVTVRLQRDPGLYTIPSCSPASPRRVRT